MNEVKSSARGTRGGSAVDPEELIYSRGLLSAEQVQQEIAKFWAELDTSSEIQTELAKAGITGELLRDANPSDAITVRVDSSGVDPETVSLIIVLAPTANRVLKDIWTTVILPRIRRRWGDNAIDDKSHNCD